MVGGLAAPKVLSRRRRGTVVQSNVGEGRPVLRHIVGNVRNSKVVICISGRSMVRRSKRRRRRFQDRLRSLLF